MKKLILWIYLAFQSLIIYPLPAQDTLLLSPGQMQEDIRHYFSTILNYNYAITYYGHQHILDSIKNELLATCNEPLPVKEFNYRLARTNKYTDGHTYVSFSGGKPEAFPYVRFSPEGLVLEDMLIQSIEGIGAGQLADDVDRMTTWEYNKKGRERYMNANINTLLGYYYGLTPPYRCRIYDTGSGEEKDSLIHTIPAEEFWKHFQPVYNSEYHNSPLNYAVYPEDSIAVLYYNDSFLIKMDNWESHEKWFEDFFFMIDKQHIKYLFIDVSQNGGGSDLTHEYIYKYLKSEPYTRKTISYYTPNILYEHYDKQMDLLMQKPEFEGWTREEIIEFIKEEEEWKSMQQLLEEKKIRGEYEIKPNPDGFAGKVFVIMGYSSYSAAFGFCEGIKSRKAGILVGEESMQRSPYAGNRETATLPHSNIAFYCATNFFTVEPVVVNEQGFLQPDIPYPMEKPLELEDFKTIIKLAEEKAAVH